MVVRADGAGASSQVPSWPEFYRTPPGLDRALRQAAGHAALLQRCLGQRVLEVGVGTGILSTVLSAFSEVTVLDLEPGVLRSAAEAGCLARVRALVGDGRLLPFRPDSFGIVYSQGLWEHFGDADVCAFVEEALRVAPTVLASVPSNWYPRAGRLGKRLIDNGLRGDERLLSPQQWVARLREVGFAATGGYYSDGKVLLVGGRPLSYPNQVLIEVRR